MHPRANTMVRFIGPMPAEFGRWGEGGREGAIRWGGHASGWGGPGSLVAAIGCGRCIADTDPSRP